MLFQSSRKETNDYLGDSLHHLMENIVITHSNPANTVCVKCLMEMYVSIRSKDRGKIHVIPEKSKRGQ
jgi:hypothetical protein